MDAEQTAQDLLARYDGQHAAAWARQWAALADHAGWRCWGFASWQEWAKDVQRRLERG
jgi:hypothetical protein